MPATPTDFLSILRTLNEHAVEYIVVGGVGAVLQGAPVSTFDLDIVHSRTPDNLQRLLAALKNLDAHYRMQPERRIRPGASHLVSPGNQLLMTNYGPLDLPGVIGQSEGYEQLLGFTREIEVASAVTIRVLGLPKLIEVKLETAGEKDLGTLPILRKTLEEKGRK